jgi:hypothetical protein
MLANFLSQEIDVPTISAEDVELLESRKLLQAGAAPVFMSIGQGAPVFLFIGEGSGEEEALDLLG